MDRRRFVGAVAAAGALALAGCSGAASSDGADCTTEALAHGDGDAIQQASAVPDGEDVRLEVTLTESAVGSVDRIAVSDGFGDGFVLPATGERTIARHLGERPLHGRYVIVAVGEASGSTPAVGGDGPKLDELTIEVHCGRDGGG